MDSNHAAMAAAAALSNPYFLAAAAAASSRDVNETSSSTARMSSFDDHHHHQHLTSSATIKRSLSPSFFSKSNDDHTKKFVSATNPTLSFTLPNTTNSPSLLSQVSKLKIVTKGNRTTILLMKSFLLFGR